MIDYFDHVVLGVSSIDVATRAFQVAGFDVLDRKDPPAAFETRLIRFSDQSYIELLTFNGASTHRFQPRFACGEGWIDYAVGNSQLAASEKALAGFFPVPPAPRTISRRTGEGRQWTLEMLEPGLGLGEPVLPFLTNELTPRDWRVPLLSPEIKQPFGISGIAGVTVVTESLSIAVPRMRTVFGEPETIEPRHGVGTQSLLFKFGANWVELVESRDTQTPVSEHLRMRGSGLYEVSLRGIGWQQMLDVGGLFGARLRLEADTP